ncbi:MAG: hypothetical protein IKF38_05540 [Clostridia bacterium]|nr:hypothetical protein [Clostridia bacterium]
MKQFVFNNETLGGVVYKTQNIIIQKIQGGKKRNRCYIIGNGYSLSVDSNCVITKHDSGMDKFQPKINANHSVYAFYFTFECSGLEEASREIADFINKLSENYEQIFLIGHSKCGLCLYNASHYCNKKLILVTISTPFSGTILADKNAVEQTLKSRVLKKIYNNIFGNHNVDSDIIPNSLFIQNLQAAHYEKHINITSSFKNLFDCKSIVDFLLYFLDKIMKIDGDGLVPLNSQNTNSTRTINISCSHANSLKEGIDLVEKM